jgi:acyl carrier protein
VEATLFIDLFSDALRSEEPIFIDMPLRDIPEWDSMAAMVVLALAERKFSKKISLLDLKKLTTVRELYELLTG